MSSDLSGVTLPSILCKTLITGLVIALLLITFPFPNVQTAYAQPDYDLLIITPNEFVDEITPLKEFKDATGRPTVIITLENIYANPVYNGADMAEEVKRCIADYEATHNIRYVLLVGDVDRLPMRYFYFKRMDSENVYWLSYYLTDHYYADLYDSVGAFCSWNADADSYYAELVDEDNDGDYVNIDGMDFEFDVVVGRIPASTAAEVTAYVNKVIKYEKEMVFGDWFNNILIVTGTGTWIYPDDVNQSNIIANKMTAAGFNAVKLYHTNPPGDTYPNPDNINDYLNIGAGFMNVYSHGAPDSWGVYTVPDDMDDLTNEDKLTFIYSCGCHTCRVGPRAPAEPYMDTAGILRDYGAAYNFTAPVSIASWVEPPKPDPLQGPATDLPCMPEYWNDSYAKGAVAFVGSTAETASPNYFYIVQYFWDSVADGTRVLGDAWDYVNGVVIASHPLETDFEWARRYMHVNIFGDPTLVLGGLADRPPETTLSHGVPAFVDGDVTFVSSSTPMTLLGTDDIAVASTHYRYYVDGSSPPAYSMYSGPFTLSGEDGTYSIQYYSVDSVGNSEYPVKCDYVTLDNTAPTTALTIGSPSYIDTYVKSTTPFTLSAADGSGSGVAEIYYKIDSGVFATYAGAFTLSGEGLHTMYFYSVDELGNTETEQSQTVIVDDTPPEVDIEIPTDGDYVFGDVTIQISAADAGSGVHSVEYSPDDGTTWLSAIYDSASAKWLGMWDTTALPEGTCTVLAKAEDNIGNAGEDETPPSVTIVYLDCELSFSDSTLNPIEEFDVVFSEQKGNIYKVSTNPGTIYEIIAITNTGTSVILPELVLDVLIPLEADFLGTGEEAFQLMGAKPTSIYLNGVDVTPPGKWVPDLGSLNITQELGPGDTIMIKIHFEYSFRGEKYDESQVLGWSGEDYNFVADLVSPIGPSWSNMLVAIPAMP